MISKKSVFLYSPAAFKHVRVWEKSRSAPLGLLAVASMIPLDKYDVKIYEGFPDMQSEMLANLKDALCVGIGVMTGVQIHHGLQIAKLIKKEFPDIPIIWGGYHPSILPEQTVANPNVDIVVRGYGERTFAELVEAIASGKSFDSIKGITYKMNGRTHSNPDREIENINNFPPLPYHLIDLKKYIIVKGNKRTIDYISSRGCPFNCGFCADVIVYKRKWNCLSAERVVKELEWLSKHYDFDAVRFSDSNFFTDEKRVKEICSGIIRLGLKFDLTNCNGATSVLKKYSSGTWELLQKVNCKNILVGAESGFPLALELVQKPSTAADTLAVAYITKKYDISVTYSLMSGFPYDLQKEKLKSVQREELVHTMRLVSDLTKIEGISSDIMLFVFTPYPGSQLFVQSVKMGFAPPENLDEWGEITLDDVKLPWINTEFSELSDDCRFQIEILSWGDRYLERLFSLFPAKIRLKNVLEKKARRLLGGVQISIRNRLDSGELELPFSLRIAKDCVSIARVLITAVFAIANKVKEKA